MKLESGLCISLDQAAAMIFPRWSMDRPSISNDEWRRRVFDAPNSVVMVFPLWCAKRGLTAELTVDQSTQRYCFQLGEHLDQLGSVM
ncbi:MAG TPA: hypothetical protein VGN60_07490 [Devosia sp.]|jgi:hypothetical protein|nr:hypothetical protein [Devosia sp.]